MNILLYFSICKKLAFESVDHTQLCEIIKNSPLSDRNKILINWLYQNYNSSLDGKTTIKLKRGVP